MRYFLSFSCEGDTLAATLDRPEGSPKTGLLIVSGGNEIRSGAHRGMAMLARRLAEQGHAVFRFDRRGIGDSTGINGRFMTSGSDISAALETFLVQCPSIERIVAFGNCDAASALVLHGPFEAIDAQVLANPWVIEEASSDASDSAPNDLPSAAAIRARYLAKLKDPREWLRLLRGGVDFGKLVRGLAKARGDNTPSVLADRVGAALGDCQTPSIVLLAEGDRTAIEFIAAWKSRAFVGARSNPVIETQRLNSPSHSFARESDAKWLEGQLNAALKT